MTRRHKRVLAAVGAATAAFLLLTAESCGGKVMEPLKDAPVVERNYDGAGVGNMPDGFGNWASKCDHGNRVYTLYHGDQPYGAIEVVPNDPSCKESR